MVVACLDSGTTTSVGACCFGATCDLSVFMPLGLVLLDEDPLVVAVTPLCKVGVPPVSPVFRTHISMVDEFHTVQLTQKCNKIQVGGDGDLNSECSERQGSILVKHRHTGQRSPR